MQQLQKSEELISRITDRIRRSLDLTEILQTAAAEVRAVLATDRVKIYRFYEDGHGQVIAEAIHENRLPSLLGLHFPADDIPAAAREMFVKARQRSIVDLDKQQIGIARQEPIPNSELESKATGTQPVGTTAATSIHCRPIDPCHIEYLRTMGVRSSVVVPILQGQQLWGLLVAHHAEARRVAETDLQLLQAVVDQLEVAITQATLVSQIQQQAQHQSSVNQVATLLHSVPTIQLQPALEAAIAILQGVGGRLYLLPLDNSDAELYTTGQQPTYDRPLEQHYLWQQHLTQADAPLLAVHDLYHEPAFRTLMPAFRPAEICGVLMLPLHYQQRCLGCLTVFREQIAMETLWAGEHNPDQRQTIPRHSFAAWRELKLGQSQRWTTADLELATSIGQHFSMAIQQHYLYRQVQTLNTNLEQQVQERTASLQQSMEQQKAMANVVTNIRASLDLDSIFQVTVQQVQQLLAADRVAIFAFELGSDWQTGRMIAEAVRPEFSSMLTVEIHDHCFGQDYAAAYRSGRIHVVADLENADLTDCHLQILRNHQIRANLVVPLLEGDYLWGLLCLHQCRCSRNWQASEIEFVQQIALQLSIGIQQAKLLAQTQQQTEQLRQTLYQLQKTQSQLVQTEKMSSLGQLVAGVAHEINNPINFIYGNVEYAKRYVDALLQVITVYQQQYPQPNAEIQSVLQAVDFEFLTVDFAKILSSMEMGAERIQEIVQSLRSFSRLDEADYKLVDLHEGIDSTLLILQHRLKANSATDPIEVIKHYGDLPPVECYAGRLNQVFMNILSNAIDALETAASFSENSASCLSRTKSQVKSQVKSRIKSQIKISTYLTQTAGQQRVAITIADNGSGIPESIQSRIFDPFFTTKPIGHGTGLGLAISYQVVTEQHRGTLQCFSQPGKGTEFRIELPLKQMG